MSDAAYVIWSFEHTAWWAPGRCGYTPYLSRAGRYSPADAATIVAQANIVTRNEVAVLFEDADGRPWASGRPHDT